MSAPDIAIIDYQMGNLRSVQKALERVGANAVITDDADRIGSAKKVILPGVGAFGDAMRELNARQLPEVIIDSIRAGKPFLGICLGLQLLFDTGFEGKEHAGLGVLGGDVVRFQGDATRKVPHMGWNRVFAKKAGCPLSMGAEESPYFYFVHSYYVRPADANAIWLECEYGHPFCAAVWRDNLFATQFHPEKSQSNGLELLKSFARL